MHTSAAGEAITVSPALLISHGPRSWASVTWGPRPCEGTAEGYNYAEPSALVYVALHKIYVVEISVAALLDRDLSLSPSQIEATGKTRTAASSRATRAQVVPIVAASSAQHVQYTTRDRPSVSGSCSIATWISTCAAGCPG